jgi:pimeloyl-ACP methyl ester carboxylesterase
MNVTRGTFDTVSGMSRRNLLVAGTTVVASLLEGHVSKAGNSGAIDGLKTYDVTTNGISLHVTELGDGPAVLFVHGFPDTAYTWRQQMQAVASAGYRAVAPDMRGYGRSSAPADPALYTPLQTVGDLVGLLDTLQLPQATIVGHDWGANVAWNAAMMRPDRFKAVFCLAVPYAPRGKTSVLDAMRAAGHENNFYMFEQIRPDADQVWADAAVTIPGMLYWASGSAPATEAWDPFDPSRNLHRKAPDRLPAWIRRDYLTHTVAEFQRTGFHGALNYYRAIQPFFDLSSAYVGARISQPSTFIWGKSDGLFPIYHLTEAAMRERLPGLRDYVGLDGVGHWVQHEAANEVSDRLVSFLRTVDPA